MVGDLLPGCDLYSGCGICRPQGPARPPSAALSPHWIHVLWASDVVRLFSNVAVVTPPVPGVDRDQADRDISAAHDWSECG